jgi:hypothetical protein
MKALLKQKNKPHKYQADFNILNNRAEVAIAVGHNALALTYIKEMQKLLKQLAKEGKNTNGK